MNIFALDIDPHAIARHYPDIHLRKMMVEYVQLLSNVWPEDKAVYKRTHYNHPCSKWVRESRQNYEWLYSLVHSMGWEYFNRFSKRHFSCIKLRELPYNAPHLPAIELTAWPQVMPIEHKQYSIKIFSNFMGLGDIYRHSIEDSIFAYRRYYAAKLRDFRQRGICKFTNRLNISQRTLYSTRGDRLPLV